MEVFFGIEFFDWKWIFWLEVNFFCFGWNRDEDFLLVESDIKIFCWLKVRWRLLIGWKWDKDFWLVESEEFLMLIGIGVKIFWLGWIKSFLFWLKWIQSFLILISRTKESLISIRRNKDLFILFVSEIKFFDLNEC